MKKPNKERKDTNMRKKTINTNCLIREAKDVLPKQTVDMLKKQKERVK